MFTDKAVVDPEEGHLTGLVEQVGEGYEGIGCVQVQYQHCCDERHSLHLNTCQLVSMKLTFRGSEKNTKLSKVDAKSKTRRKKSCTER